MPSERNIARKHYRVYDKNKPNLANNVPIFLRRPNLVYAISSLLILKGLFVGYILGKQR